MAFVSGLFVSGILGFMMGIVSVMQIRATSPLTHNISGTAKAGAQSAMAFYIWGNTATYMACAGKATGARQRHAKASIFPSLSLVEFCDALRGSVRAAVRLQWYFRELCWHLPY